MSNVSDLPLFASDVKARDRVIDTLARVRREWVSKIEERLIPLAQEMGIVTANDVRRVFESFTERPELDTRFFVAVFKRPGWAFVDWDGKSDTPGNHARRIARWRWAGESSEEAA